MICCLWLNVSMETAMSQNISNWCRLLQVDEHYTSYGHAEEERAAYGKWYDSSLFRCFDCFWFTIEANVWVFSTLLLCIAAVFASMFAAHLFPTSMFGTASIVAAYKLCHLITVIEMTFVHWHNCLNDSLLNNSCRSRNWHRHRLLNNNARLGLWMELRLLSRNNHGWRRYGLLHWDTWLLGIHRRHRLSGLAILLHLYTLCVLIWGYWHLIYEELNYIVVLSTSLLQLYK